MNKLVYTEENDLRIYESMPLQDFKEFFMAYFKYNKGDNVEISDFTNPMTFAIFCQYIPKLDKMEENYKKKAAANRENGKKGGRPKKDNTGDLTASNTPSDISNQTTKDNGSESLKMTNTRDIPSEFAIPTPEVDEPTEIDDTGDFYFEWQSECERLIKDAMIDTLEGNGYAMRECNNKLQEIYNVCVANGCSEVLLSQIKDSVKERVSNEVEKEYNEKVA
jgi:hypothetical protein